MHRTIEGLKGFLLLGAVLWLISSETHAANEAYAIIVQSGHPWRPPFGLDRVGKPINLVIESSQPPRHSGYLLTVLHQGKEVGRHPLSFAAKPPFSAPVTIKEYGDEVVLSVEKANETGRLELARQLIHIPKAELDAVARPDSVTNPVDLGTILVPRGWLLLGPGQGGGLSIAAICRDRDEPEARVRAFFQSAPGRETTAAAALLTGQKRVLALRLPEASKTLDRDVLQVALVNGRGEPLAEKSIAVMLVQKPPHWPRFGASYARLRYDAPISVRDPRTGTFSSLKYEDGWAPELQDVVVSLPNGARFVFWRGSSYIPFWAGKHNTGACYEWAEVISGLKDAVDCVEPLMDKELRYGRVEIVESTAARVHVRWTYQSTDLHYKVWGDEAVEDYYFYPDGFGTRVLTLKSDPANDYELSEFIILTPQGAYPVRSVARGTRRGDRSGRTEARELSFSVPGRRIRRPAQADHASRYLSPATEQGRIGSGDLFQSAGPPVPRSDLRPVLGPRADCHALLLGQPLAPGQGKRDRIEDRRPDRPHALSQQCHELGKTQAGSHPISPAHRPRCPGRLQGHVLPPVGLADRDVERNGPRTGHVGQ